MYESGHFVLLFAFLQFFYNRKKQRIIFPSWYSGFWRGSISEAVKVGIWKRPFGKLRLNPYPKCPNVARRCIVASPGDQQQTLPKEVLPNLDTVLVHHRDDQTTNWTAQVLPENKELIWAWWNFESRSSSGDLQLADNFFHVTISFRSDSDIWLPYGRLVRRTSPHKLDIPVRHKMICWVVSNLKANSPRLEVANELQKFVPVDIYGSGPNAKRVESITETISEYKFYLAFENSKHDDYITEKLWQNAFTTYTVPVVMGPPRSNYEKFIPRDSFIHVDDFSSVRELADYLKQVGNNHTLWRQYLSFHSDYRVEIESSNALDFEWNTSNVIDVTASSSCGNLCCNVLDYGWNRHWNTNNVPNSWIQFDMKGSRVPLASYTIETYNGRPRLKSEPGAKDTDAQNGSCCVHTDWSKLDEHWQFTN